MKSSFDTANMFLLCTEAMSCKAIHTHLYIPVTNTHSVKFCFLLLKELQPPCNFFFFKVLSLAMVTSQQLSLQTPQIILSMPMKHKLHFFHNCQSSTSKYF